MRDDRVSLGCEPSLYESSHGDGAASPQLVAGHPRCMKATSSSSTTAAAAPAADSFLPRRSATVLFPAPMGPAMTSNSFTGPTLRLGASLWPAPCACPRRAGQPP